MNIQAIFSHFFVKRDFAGLLAQSWGFMLGGCLLMTAVTYGTAYAGFSRLGVELWQVAVLVILLPLSWMIMSSTYQERGIKDREGFVRSFFIALMFGATMPVWLAFLIWIACRVLTSRKASSGALHRVLPRQRVGFWQDVMAQFLLRMAH